MKKGKVILSAAAFIITAIGSIAFKTSHKFASAQLKGTAKNAVPAVACSAVTCWFLEGGAKGTCHTVTEGKAVTALYISNNACTVRYIGGYTKTAD